ncbi:hypothetical protein BC940DRAFT_291050 [Gongronella butleri]|nr:hypothetical protein BC940DRAFT_291050 [Gongronella butleri]
MAHDDVRNYVVTSFYRLRAKIKKGTSPSLPFFLPNCACRVPCSRRQNVINSCFLFYFVVHLCFPSSLWLPSDYIVGISFFLARTFNKAIGGRRVLSYIKRLPLIAESSKARVAQDKGKKTRCKTRHAPSNEQIRLSSFSPSPPSLSCRLFSRAFLVAF